VKDVKQTTGELKAAAAAGRFVVFFFLMYLLTMSVTQAK